MKQTLIIIVSVIGVVSGIVIAFTYFQAYQERLTMTAELQNRSFLIAESLKESVEPLYLANSIAILQSIVDKFASRQQLVGLAIYDENNSLVVATKGLEVNSIATSTIVSAAERANSASGTFVSTDGKSSYLFVDPLHQGTSVVGALVIVEDASFIDANIYSLWLNNLFRLLLQALVFIAAIFAFIRWVVYKPIMSMVESMRSARTGNGAAREKSSILKENFFFMPLAGEIARMTDSLSQARTAASIEARMRLEKLDTPWTSSRLQEFIKAYVKNRPIYVISNREPYIHTKSGNDTRVSVPASGMVTALEPVMEACGGMWIAHGSGNADVETADKDGKLRVPPDEPRYTLKRVWLDEKEVHGYYTGFSNEALWPLCHMAHTRPIFRKDDWQMYKAVNGKFAQALLAEIKNVQRPLILVQDFHLALLPAMIKASRPDAQIALFWHVPWPSAEAFSICPFRKEILDGMLGSDIVGFHTQQYCNNFIESVSKEIESVVDFEQFAITSEGHRSLIKPFPISIAFTETEDDHHDSASITAKLKELGIRSEFVGLGVDRLDYTKGIIERFKGIEYLLDTNPKYRGRFTFLQISPPSRETVEKYREYNDDVTAEAERINTKFRAKDWVPIVLEKKHYSHKELFPLYRRADFCLVTSLHDGMNLVAKEYVAARTDESGALILSQFTGASRDLKGALLINPYSAEETAEAIHTALTMPPTEKYRRMKSMRAVIRDYNIYRWSAELIKAVADLG